MCQTDVNQIFSCLGNDINFQSGGLLAKVVDLNPSGITAGKDKLDMNKTIDLINKCNEKYMSCAKVSFDICMASNKNGGEDQTQIIKDYYFDKNADIIDGRKGGQLKQIFANTLEETYTKTLFCMQLFYSRDFIEEP